MTTELLTQTEAFLNGKMSITPETVPLLQELIREHNRRYYVESAPLIDDGEYDRLFKLLVDAEERFGIYDPNSPTKRIDVLVSRQFEKGRHKYPMISLDNTYDTDDILEFAKRARNVLKKNVTLESCLELKFDGLGISLLYRDGVLVRALTRGNGIEGEDVTINALEIASIPRKIDFMDEVEIR